MKRKSKNFYILEKCLSDGDIIIYLFFFQTLLKFIKILFYIFYKGLINILDINEIVLHEYYIKIKNNKNLKNQLFHLQD